MKVSIVSINAKGFTLPPYGAWVLKAYLDEYSSEFGEVETEVLSFSYDVSITEIAQNIVKSNPDLLGFSHYIWNDSKTIKLLNFIKEELGLEKHIIVGGPHADRSDERLMNFLEKKKIDAIIIGEGEKPLYHITKCIYDKEVITPIEGIVCRHEGGINTYKPQVHIAKDDINYLPNPYIVCKELFDLSLKSGSIQYEGSRGCPFSCTFCDQGHKAYRKLTIERIKTDLDFFSQYNPNHIDFLDGTFNLTVKRTIELLNYLIDLNKRIGTTYHAEIKPELLTREEIILMKKANFRSVELGLQTIHKDTLLRIKRRNNYSKLEEAVQFLIDNDIEPIINTIIGLPGEGLELWYESLDYCFSLGRVKILSNVLKILPNTVMADEIDIYGFNFNRENFNAIESTNTLSFVELNKAIVVNKLVNMFWNKMNKPVSIQYLTNEIYSGKFHKLMEDIANRIIQHPTITSDINFKLHILEDLLESSLLDCNKKNIIRSKLKEEFLIKGVKSNATVK
ncbi:B12-binding domain-containing radical SAM protein [Bacillus cereus]|uniref:B12-binding domain-containing radical SAM protein n=1 Tax=Bacillus cereus TaxID=1396 RepID=UPI0009919BE6|nr:radical SAM protein [Bacillus cereus]OOQ93155.1 radical SAM protein [Bacillus cereus]